MFKGWPLIHSCILTYITTFFIIFQFFSKNLYIFIQNQEKIRAVFNIP